MVTEHVKQEKMSLHFRSSGGYESGSTDSDEQLMPKFDPHIKGFPIMLIENAKRSYKSEPID